MEGKYEYILKFILIGNTGVGKSALMLRYTSELYEDKHNPTVGIEFGTKIITTEQGTAVKLQLWDTAGQEAFQSVTRGYYRNCAGVILVYDITERDSFEQLNKWVHEVKANSGENVSVALVGNKADLIEK